MRKLTVTAMAMSVAAAFYGLACAADTATVKGEVVDTYCFSLAGAKGEGHRSCGLDCAAKGIPVAILENDTNKVYVLLPKKEKSQVPKEVIDRMGRQVTITGKVAKVGGSQFLTVESFE
jgi:hypothetical protein